jgi:hypothetical protein
VAFGRGDRAGHRAGQDPVDDQVQQRAVQAQGDASAGVLEPDRDRLAGDGDDPDPVRGPVDLDR